MAEEIKIQSTFSLNQAKETIWDVIIVGAGPAGSLTARKLAKRNLKVLLLDKDYHPRFKVCGCCLAPLGVSLLKDEGVFAELQDQALELKNILIMSRGKQIKLTLNGGITLSRSFLDSFLITKAKEAGAAVLFGAKAKFGSIEKDFATVLIKTIEEETFKLQTKIIVGATGLWGSNFTSCDQQPKSEYRANSYIGIGMETENINPNLSTSTIFMALGKEGYIGASLVKNTKINLAGALSPSFIRKNKGLKEAVRAIFNEAGATELLAFSHFDWKGTPLLTRSGKISDIRYFAIGDACGYVEPFTGEGMTWALQSAILVTPLIVQGVLAWNSELSRCWELCYKKNIGKSQRFCHLTKKLLRLPPSLKETLLQNSTSNLALHLLAAMSKSSLPSWIS